MDPYSENGTGVYARRVQQMYPIPLDDNEAMKKKKVTSSKATFQPTWLKSEEENRRREFWLFLVDVMNLLISLFCGLGISHLIHDRFYELFGLYPGIIIGLSIGMVISVVIYLSLAKFIQRF